MANLPSQRTYTNVKLCQNGKNFVVYPRIKRKIVQPLSTNAFLQQVTAAKLSELPHLKKRYANIKPHTSLPNLAVTLRKQSRTPQLICELKPASPSQGKLQQENAPLESYIEAYEKEAVALSVLTESSFFGGSPELFASIRQQSQRPLLWKDFVINSFQIDLAQALGANGLLLIVKLLDNAMLERLYQDTLKAGLSPVIEVQNNEDVERALRLTPQPELFLINHRDLNTLKLDMTTTAQLAPSLPKSSLIISASGIETAEDIASLKPYCHTFLIGSSLMRTPINELPAKLKTLKQ